MSTSTDEPSPLPATGPGAPTPPIAISGSHDGVSSHLTSQRVEIPEAVLRRLGDAASNVEVDAATVAEASRDWWPLAMTWATHGEVGALAHAVVRPESASEVAAVLAVCDEARVPVTAAGGRSGVCGASVPLHGGVVLDLTALSGIIDVDPQSLILDVAPGTFGDHLESRLRAEHQVTLGHWPQSMALSTVGGWLACRSAGQMSTRYGKIEDMVLGLDVALADGRLVSTGGAPRSAQGPDLNQVFVGSEGTLGIICGARLQLHPAPVVEQRGAWLVESFEAGLDAMRRVIQRGATPAVLRLYDPAEADRTYQTGGKALVLALDEGDPGLVSSTMEVVATELLAASGGEPAPEAHVQRWLEHRNEVAALEKLISKGYVVDTMEVTGLWRDLPTIYRTTLEALESVEGTLAASAHQSHSYHGGGCLYFTFAGQVEPDKRDAYYQELWNAGQRAALASGGSLSHHHGVGLNRGRFMADALGESFGVLVALKQALDPNGTLNPGKLGLPSPWQAPPGW